VFVIALAASADDYWNSHLVTPSYVVARCRVKETTDSKRTFEVVRVIYGNYALDTIALDKNSVPWGAPAEGEVILYLAKASSVPGQSSCSAYVWEDLDATEKELVRVLSAGEHMSPAPDDGIIITYFMNHPPNIVVRATLESVDDKASHWKVSKVLVPAPAAGQSKGESLRSLGYVDSPKPVFPPPSAAPIPAAGESVVVRLDAWKRRAETIVRYRDPEKPGAAASDDVAGAFGKLAAVELIPGREAVLFLEDCGRLDDRPAYDAIVVTPPASAASEEIDETIEAVRKAAAEMGRLRPL